MSRCRLLLASLILLAAYGCTHAPDRQPDLVIEADGIYKSPFLNCYVQSGQHLNGLEVRVTNQGDAASGPFVVSVYDVWQTVDAADQVAESDEQNNAVAPGDSTTFWLDAGAIRGEGTTFAVEVDAALQIEEYDEANNTYQGVYSTSPLPPCK